MADHTQLPELPLMLAGIAAPVANLLREAGLPVEPLPRVALLASGTGRFVLFDSRNNGSVRQARRAQSQGLKPIDIAPWTPAINDSADSFDPASPEAGWPEPVSARSFLDQLKSELESRGGIWVRVADFPFPYQSALGVGIEQQGEELTGFAEIAAALPVAATHFVSSRLREDCFEHLATAGSVDLGWEIRPEDCEVTARKTLSHWQTRQQRFTSAKLSPAGLSFASAGAPIPTAKSLSSLGFRYSCQPHSGLACHSRPVDRRLSDEAWVQFGTLPLPAHEDLVYWVGEHYQAGCPLFITEPATRPDLLQELLCLAGDAARCSLMWRTTFGEFSHWWRMRRAFKLQVWRTSDGYSIHGEGDFRPFRWAVEIWRGQHLAVLPLRHPDLQVRDDGIVYLRAVKRHPAGCLTPHDSLLELVLPAANSRRKAAGSSPPLSPPFFAQVRAGLTSFGKER